MYYYCTGHQYGVAFVLKVNWIRETPEGRKDKKWSREEKGKGREKSK